MVGEDNARLVALSPLASTYDGLLLDLDGCLYVGDEVVPGGPEALHEWRAAGKEVAFVTNDGRRSIEAYVRKLWGLGYQANVHEVVSVGTAVQHVLADRGGGTAFVIGAEPLIGHVAAAGMRVVNNTPIANRAEVVVVALHDRFAYAEMKVAVQAVLAGAELIGTTRDPTFPNPDGPWPASGALLAAIEYAVGREADIVVGKPAVAMYETARAHMTAERLLVVGDRLDTDIAGGAAAGHDTALVLTGGSTAGDIEGAAVKPTHVAPSVRDLLLDS
jgi:HAD superfamily hydrolase (TIGR01450 family)